MGGVGPQFAVPAQEPWRNDDDGPFANASSFKSLFAARLARKHWNRWIEPHNFFKNCARIDQFWHVRERRRPVTQDLVDLAVKASLDLRCLRQDVPCPGKGIGRGFMSRHQQDDGLVAQLLRIKRRPRLFVASIEEPADYRCPVTTTLRSQFCDDVVDGSMDAPDRAI